MKCPSLNVKSIRTKELQAGECVTEEYAETLTESTLAPERGKEYRQQRAAEKNRIRN